MSKIGAVIVTYNRLEKLKKALMLFEEQTTSLDLMVIVDNCSTDGTREFLLEWVKEKSIFKREIVFSEENIGGSGGFYLGLSKAQILGMDWIWVSDDDAFPDKDALYYAREYLTSHKKAIMDCSAICGAVINNEKIDLAHRRNIQWTGTKVIDQIIEESEYQKEDFTINAFSYVGTIINVKKLLEVGLPVKDYFIYYDDTEHSLRLSEKGKIVVVPKIKVHHDVLGEKIKYSWKTYYGIRNELNMIYRRFRKKAYQNKLREHRNKIIRYKIKKYLGLASEDNKIYLGIVTDAVNDAVNNKLGLHPKYRPGWNP